MLPALPTPLQPAREAAPCDADGLVAPRPWPAQRACREASTADFRFEQVTNGRTRPPSALTPRLPSVKLPGVITSCPRG